MADRKDSADDHIPVERMFTLLDGVVAIAMTILVLDIRLPPDLAGAPLQQAMLRIGHQILYFLLSVVVIGLFWQGHHHVLKRATYITTSLLWLNFAFLALLALIPFPTNTLETYEGGTVGPALYGATIGATAMVELLMWLHITASGGPAIEQVSPHRRRRTTVNLVSTAAVFGGSAVVAFASPALAMYMWLLMIPARVIMNRKMRQQPD